MDDVQVFSFLLSRVYVESCVLALNLKLVVKKQDDVLGDQNCVAYLINFIIVNNV